MIFDEYNTGRTCHKSVAFGSLLTVVMFTGNIRGLLQRVTTCLDD